MSRPGEWLQQSEIIPGGFFEGQTDSPRNAMFSKHITSLMRNIAEQVRPGIIEDNGKQTGGGRLSITLNNLKISLEKLGLSEVIVNGVSSYLSETASTLLSFVYENGDTHERTLKKFFFNKEMLDGEEKELFWDKVWEIRRALNKEKRNSVFITDENPDSKLGILYKIKENTAIEWVADGSQSEQFERKERSRWS